MRRLCLTITILAAGLLVQPATTAQPSLILQAMQEEMRRAMDGLRLANEPPPYYIAYSVEDVTLNRLHTKLGAVVREATERTRLFRVDVRVGDYTFDSSRFFSLDRDPGELASYGSYGLRVPLDEDYHVMRRQIWLATDATYKRAVQTLARKKATAQPKTPEPATFLTRIGSRVLPASFLVSDTPSLREFGQAPVPGAYAVDDDGVMAKDVKLVEDGKLLTLLTTRTPQKGLPQSNGHARYAGAQAGVFQMESARAVPAAALKARYLQMLKEQSRPYGYILRSVAGVIDPLGMAREDDRLTLAGTSSGRSGPPILRAAKVLPDGTEQAVRGLRLGAVQPLAYRLISDASLERTLYNYRGGLTGSSLMTGAPMRAMPPVVSLIVPSLIFEELEIQQSQDTRMKPPVVPPPAKK